jgi:TM2 domain-containing membrane protein YozV/Tfp pilus assembly protein PilE
MTEINDQTKFCTTCGKQIHIRAEICPGCGAKAMGTASKSVSKVALLLITFFLGGIGGHKFYLKKYGMGILYLLFFWTAIPSLIAFIEFIIYCVKNEEELQQRYPETSMAGLIIAVILPFVSFAFIGILAAIAIPQFATYRARALDATVQSNLTACVTQAESYYSDNRTYPTRMDQLSCETASDVALLYLALGQENYQIIAFHKKGNDAFLAEKGSTEIGRNSRTEIESQLADQVGWDGGYGNFYFIE